MVFSLRFDAEVKIHLNTKSKFKAAAKVSIRVETQLNKVKSCEETLAQKIHHDLSLSQRRL